MSGPRITKSKPHQTRRVVVKEAPIDVLMVELVKWLNSFESVVTLHSCQGEPPDKDGVTAAADRPYVLFLCLDHVDLIRILATIGACAATEVEWSKERACLRYCATFIGQDTLKLVP